ncbi:cytochrome b5 [Entomortierella parvispora]|uniref:Cytochrome b5 n=1 Tax=Entomortierella parvispora TaxID=205924 RepID=A0A9P3H792_9FUNG|nr:cytochrome b5 [Entomortierella parvispora]
MAPPKTYTLAELSQHTSKTSLLVAIHGKVYDVTGFIDEHPGGEEVLLDEAGKDATESFEDVGHSDEARDIMSKLYVGELNAEGASTTKPKSSYQSTPKPIPASEPTESSSSLQYVLALAVVAGCVIWKMMK